MLAVVELVLVPLALVAAALAVYGDGILRLRVDASLALRPVEALLPLQDEIGALPG